ncbi:MAG: EamA family transporter [Megasphaera sp.]|jgi:drug/metabolite transporter (DMT)-like permease|nr:EamA family transporter [Megasphaera sp.]MCI1248178.1 EamA family transporter [Megasphaera sp.]
MIKALLLLYAIWGFNWVVMKVASFYFPPITFSCYRFLSGALVLLLFNLWLRLPLPPRRYWKWIIITGLLQIAINSAAIQTGMNSLNAGLVAVLNYSMPMWVAILAHFFLHERLTLRKIIGIFISLSGLCILMNIDTAGNMSDILLCIGAAIAAAISGVIIKYQDMTMKKKDCTMIQYTTWQMTAGAIFLLLFDMCIEQGPVTWNATAVACLVYNGVLASALAFFLWNFILTQMEASKASIATLVVPVVGVLCGIIFLGETMYWNTALGMILILAGILLIVLQKSPLKLHPKISITAKK